MIFHYQKVTVLNYSGLFCQGQVFSCHYQDCSDQVLSSHYQDCSIKARHSQATIRMFFKPRYSYAIIRESSIKTRYSHSTTGLCIGPGALLPLSECPIKTRYSHATIRTVLFRPGTLMPLSGLSY